MFNGGIIAASIPVASSVLLSNTINIGAAQMAYDVVRRGFVRGSYGSLTDDGTSASEFDCITTNRTFRLSAAAIGQYAASNQLLMWLDIVSGSNFSYPSEVNSPPKAFNTFKLGNMTFNWDDSTGNIQAISGYYTRHVRGWSFGNTAWDNISASGIIGYEFS
tara:strand:- start:1173 stop:1658 length:486 start_codon:yes stop_codon:yes gene_type:complete